MRAFSNLIAIALTGCWTGSSTTPTTTSTGQPPKAEPQGLQCAEVVAHAMEISKEELSRTAKPEQIERVRIAAIDSCLAMKWSQELMVCFRDAGTGDDLGICQTKMTKVQNDDMQKRLIEAIQTDLPQNPCGNPCAP